MSSPVLAANCASSYFQSEGRCPLDPPPSAVMKILRASGYFLLPMCSHHLLMVATAKTEVSWSMPTETQALLSVTS